MIIAKNMRTRKREKKYLFPVLAVYLLIASFAKLPAAPTTSDEAATAVRGWLRQGPQMLQSRSDSGRRRIQQAGRSGGGSTVRSIRNADGETVYHIVDLQPAGFVIVSADDEIEPIVAFSANGQFDPDASNTLARLVRMDLPRRIDAVRGRGVQGKTAIRRAALASHRQNERNRWNRLRGTGAPAQLNDTGESAVNVGVAEPEDIRVTPLMLSTWSQSNVAGNWCYNYYTPNHYVCGCVATAMAQLMRHFRYPDQGVGTGSFYFYVDGALQYGNLRGGNGNGGPYDWDAMVLHPGSSMTTTQRQAIGGLCYDAGLAVNMSYAAGGSGAYMSRAASALQSVFGYGHAVITHNNGSAYDDLMVHMINPNLDAGLPVLLAIQGDGGHAVVCDGYGFQADTAYHHLNMGWGGIDDAWYNLPDVQGYYDFDTVASCIYNIFTESDGEIVSGRVFDITGSPMANVTVTARTVGGQVAGTAVSGANGIFALTHLAPNASYTVTALQEGMTFDAQVITLGESSTWPAAVGNRWGVELSVVGMAESGTLAIDVTPDSAPWCIVAHPDAYQGVLSGSGDFSALVPIGLYTISFGAVEGFATPEPVALTVVQSSPVLFAGQYNGIPTLSVPADPVAVCGEALLLSVTAQDPDGSVPSLTITAGPAGAGFIDHLDGSGALVWTPAAGQTGNYSVCFLASDGVLASSTTVDIQVLPNLPWPKNVVVSNRRPEFVWAPVDGATWYYVWINRDGVKYCSKWLNQAEGRWTPDFDLPGGNYTWWVRGWRPDIGYASWSPGADFSRPALIPAASQPIAPTADAGGVGGTFEWTEAESATWYCVWLNRNSGTYSTWWVENATTSACPKRLTFGTYQWWVRTWNVDGYGPWSASAAFSVGGTMPLSPTGTQEASPGAFIWDDSQSSQAAWYQLWINREGSAYWNGWVNRTDTTEQGSARSCSNLPILPLPAGTYTWWIRAWNDTGTGPWSDGTSFTVTVP